MPMPLRKKVWRRVALRVYCYYFSARRLRFCHDATWQDDGDHDENSDIYYFFAALRLLRLLITECL